MNTKQEYLISDDMSRKIVETVRQLARQEGVSQITVSKVLQELGITNRVFYNRFHNIDEVLRKVYRNMAFSLHQSVELNYESSDEFFDAISQIIQEILILCYEEKEGLVHFIFEQDSKNNENFAWWFNEIKRILDFAVERGFILPVNVDYISYALWCYIRGFNTDAITRNIPLEEALAAFDYSFKIFINGLKRAD